MAPVLQPRVRKAGNPGPFTLDGTRTYLLGEQRVAVIDPGPDEEEHVRALLRALVKAREVRILLTHAHGDHAAAARTLAARIGASVLGPPSALARYFRSGIAGEPALDGGPEFHPLKGGEDVPTDAGSLVVLATPGHTVDHLSYRWEAGEGLFVGDLLLGRGSTTWLGEYPGCVSDFLESIDRVRTCGARVLYPAHGPPVTDPAEALDRFRAHRLKRLGQLQTALDLDPCAGLETLVEAIYGPDLPERMARAARASVEVMLHHLREAEPET